jgi:cysteine synthase A
MIVTLLCDSGDLYFNRLFNPAWLSEKGLVAA